MNSLKVIQDYPDISFIENYTMEKLEADIVRDLINYGLDKTIEIFKSKYSGNTIEKDIKEFYLELVDKKVIIDIEGVK